MSQPDSNALFGDLVRWLCDSHQMDVSSLKVTPKDMPGNLRPLPDRTRRLELTSPLAPSSHLSRCRSRSRHLLRRPLQSVRSSARPDIDPNLCSPQRSNAATSLPSLLLASLPPQVVDQAIEQAFSIDDRTRSSPSPYSHPTPHAPSSAPLPLRRQTSLPSRRPLGALRPHPALLVPLPSPSDVARRPCRR
jgi:hypothetical protein